MVDAPAIGPIRLRHVVAEINRYLAKRVLVDLAEEAGERVLQPRLLELQVEVDLGALPADRVEVEGARPMDAVEGGAVEIAGRLARLADRNDVDDVGRSEEHTSELQSLMRISYAVFCLKKKKNVVQLKKKKMCVKKRKTITSGK